MGNFALGDVAIEEDPGVLGEPHGVMAGLACPGERDDGDVGNELAGSFHDLEQVAHLEIHVDGEHDAVDVGVVGAEAQADALAATSTEQQSRALTELIKLQRDRAAIGPQTAREQAKAELAAKTSLTSGKVLMAAE